jgi:molecular chaperone GrpE
MTDDNKTGAPEAAGVSGDSLVPEADEILGDRANENRTTEPDAEAELRRERDELKDQLLRAHAEMENLRRRTARDVHDARAYAVTSFARDLLNVADNFHRALSSMEGKSGDDLAPDLKGLLEGVRMTERELLSVFERHGVKVIDPTGQRFDPNRHQAMFEIENADVPSGTVLQVLQAGSMIGERVLRPAMVAVSKGGPKPEQRSADADTAGGDAG